MLEQIKGHTLQKISIISMTISLSLKLFEMHKSLIIFISRGYHAVMRANSYNETPVQVDSLAYCKVCISSFALAFKKLLWLFTF
jgi:hypothetical protein